MCWCNQGGRYYYYYYYYLISLLTVGGGRGHARKGLRTTQKYGKDMPNKSINVTAPHLRHVRKPYYAHNSYHTLSRNKNPEKAPAQVVYGRFVLLSNGAVLFIFLLYFHQQRTITFIIHTLNISFRNNLYANNYLFIRKYWNTSGRCRCFTNAAIQDSNIFSLM